jgi:hypothetical protein
MIISIDFDGVIVEDKYPNIGKIKEGAKEVINELFHNKDNVLILNTCRANSHLQEAKHFLKEHNIPFHLINENTPSLIAKHGGDTRKIYADVYIDDKNLGGFQGWSKVKEILLDKK